MDHSLFTASGEMSEAACCPAYNATSGSLACPDPKNGCPVRGPVSDKTRNQACSVCMVSPELCFDLYQTMWPDHCVQTGADGKDGTFSRFSANAIALHVTFDRILVLAYRSQQPKHLDWTASKLTRHARPCTMLIYAHLVLHLADKFVAATQGTGRFHPVLLRSRMLLQGWMRWSSASESTRTLIHTLLSETTQSRSASASRIDSYIDPYIDSPSALRDNTKQVSESPSAPLGLD
jgi:hypothetical protein